MKRILLLIGFLGILSCKEKRTSNESTYFVGEVVNPTSDFVVLYKDNLVVDSVVLDNDNRFSFHLEDIREGLHYFTHSTQGQYVYLEKGDSILTWLNAPEVYFDESLVFSGDNEELNNFIIEMFLAYEKEEPLIFTYYSLPPKDFSFKIDSLRNLKMKELEQLTPNNELSEKAYSVIRASVDFNSYISKEQYLFLHKNKISEPFINELKNDFYNYRSELDLNNKELVWYRPYYDFVKHHIMNLSFMDCYNNCGKQVSLSQKQQLHLIRHKFSVVDSLITEPRLRDNLFRYFTISYLLKVHLANKDTDNFMKEFEKLSSNETHITELQLLYNSVRNLQPKKELPNLVLEDFEGNINKSLKGISKGNNTVFYFWTYRYKSHFRNVIEQVALLREIHPNIKFVGISLSTDRAHWLELLNESGVDPQNQYRSDDHTAIKNALLIDYLNKCVISKDTLIEDAFANIYTAFGQ